MDGKEILNFDTNAMTWEGLDVKELNFAIPWIPLHEDPETSANVFVMRYPAGFTNPWHHHDCSHGIYVLNRLCPDDRRYKGYPENWPEHEPSRRAATTRPRTAI